MAIDIEKERILVTGKGGMLGGALNKELRRRGCNEIVAPSRTEVDLTSAHRVEALFLDLRPTVVFHCASKVFGLKGNIESPEEVFYTNTLIDTCVLRAAGMVRPKKIIVASTVAAYPYPFPSLPLKEVDLWCGEPHSGEYGYAQVKRHFLAGLNVLNRAQGVDYAGCLLTNLYGPGDNFNIETGHVIPSLIMKALMAKVAGSDLRVWGDGSQVRDFMHVEDAARAMVDVAIGYSGLINIATGHGTSMVEVVEYIVRAVGGNVKVVWDQNMPVGIRKRTVDVERLTGLGFKCEIELREGIREVVEWVRHNADMVRK